MLFCCVVSFIGDNILSSVSFSASVINSVGSSIIDKFSAVSCLFLSPASVILDVCDFNSLSLARMRSKVISNSLFCILSARFSSIKALEFDRSSCKS